MNKVNGYSGEFKIGPTKVLAKLANTFDKKLPENHGVFGLDSEEKIESSLKKLAIEEVWRIGRQYAKLLGSVKAEG